MLKDYYQLVKPGIVYSNVMTAAAGFFLASTGHIKFMLLAATLGGIALIIASACVINNFIDQGIDSRMERTQARALVGGRISGRAAIIYGVVLGLAGFGLLLSFTNITTVVIGAIAYFAYIVLYGWFKRHSVHGTLVGTISGSIPPAAGYTAVTGHFNGVAVLLFLILVFWQMPHFYAIAMFRLKDYKAAGIPVWPLKRGIKSTKHQMLGYIVAFTIACIFLTVFGVTGRIFAAVSAVSGLIWLWRGALGYTKDDTIWARRMFFVSLIVLLVLCINLGVGARLP